MTKSQGVYLKRGTRTNWATEHDQQHNCECGCGRALRVKPHHYPDLPRFALGHNVRVAHPSGGTNRESWAAGEAGKHPCACGCGETIEVLWWHRSSGIPRYRPNHHPKDYLRKPKPELVFCDCGCGCAAAPGKRFVHGHNARRTLAEAFAEHAEPAEDDSCWGWRGFHNGNGYAIVTHDARHLRAARVAYDLHRGAVPDGLEVDHTCRVRGCVNPWHLDAVTHAENVRRQRLSPAAHRALAPKRP